MSDVDDSGEGRLDAVVVGSTAPFEVREAAIHGDRRASVVIESPATIAFRSEGISAPRLRFGLAIRPPDSNVTLSLTVNGQIVHDDVWVEKRDWVDEEIDLGAFTDEPMQLEMVFEGDATVMLAHPEIVGRAPERVRPNVIVYVIDCLRADHVGAYGYELPTTPEIDAFAQESVILEDLSSCAPWTKPSTACLFTSLLPIYHQARTVDDALAQERVTLAEAFRAAGYTTAAWVANPVIDPRVFFFNQGFDRWVDLRTFEERTTRTHANALESDAADITAAVLPWLEAHRDDTFFLYLHSLDLHFEYRARPPFDEMFVSEDSVGLERDRELYDNELAYNDREIGKLIARLKELDLYDDTVVFITSDHGEEFGEHGATRHGKTLYEQVLHIPGILKLPDSEHAGRRSAMLTSNLDVAPTLLQLAGIEPPAAFQGSRDVVAALGRPAEPSHRPVFAELVAPQHVSYSVRDERYKYIRNLAPELSEYAFDLQADAGELRSLLPDGPAGAMELRPQIERFVQLGQHGLHISIRGEIEGTRVVVEARTEPDAAIVNAFRFAMVTGDDFKPGAGGGSLRFAFTADDKARHLVLQTRPEGAPVTIEISVDDAPATSRVLDPNAVEVSIVEAESLMNADDGTPLRTWYLPFTAGRNRVDLDEETTQNLKALGYIP
jgi:arylsulfatase A-like enzyme